ncbi:hypothetical protein AVEN_206642-1 [Araneus ventricosus]|uniref:Uncharacterized protein n=1 Tax=Araneus ventricosus TaxID=182803 RepID=A0A4Y2H5J9_ARAVE|nr:hypothetical protein AVEN_206642-1 [Araneus ventricosus]
MVTKNSKNYKPTFPVEDIHKQFKKMDKNVPGAVAVFIAAAEEYLAAEIVEKAAVLCRQRERERERREKELVGLAWVKAHVGIPDNDLADHFAKLASVEVERMDIPYPYSFVKFALTKKLLEDWQIYYGAYDTASGNRNRGSITILPTTILLRENDPFSHS